MVVQLWLAQFGIFVVLLLGQVARATGGGVGCVCVGYGHMRHISARGTGDVCWEARLLDRSLVWWLRTAAAGHLL